MQKNTFRIHFVVYGIALILSTTTGTILKLFSTDPLTGFFSLGGFPFDNIILIIHRLSLLFPIVFWFFLNMRRRAVHDYPISYVQTSAGILSAITGVCIVAYTFKEVPSQIISEKLLSEQSLPFVVNSLSDRILYFSILILGILAGIAMITNLSKSRNFNMQKPGIVLGFVPAAWQMIVLFTRFNNFIAITTINDILMILLFMSFASMFLIGQSRVMFGLGVRSGKTYAIPAGLSVSLVGFSTAIPALISYFINGTLTYVVSMGPAELAYIIMLSFYAIVFTKGFTRAIKTV